MKKEHYPKLLFIIFLIFWLVLAINPNHRNNWALENIPIVLFLICLIFTYKKFKFSNLSYTLIFIFLCLVSIGAYYSFTEVPFGLWIQKFFGSTRNNYDRIAHFAFGLLLAYPVKELFIKIISTKGKWSYYLPFELILALSAIFEVIEWIIVVILADPSAGATYLGMQGDIWDAQKDMGLAGLGAAITMIIAAIRNKKF